MQPEYLTTKELAELLRIKERKIYDLAASGELPCTKAMGKLLFPRQAIDSWLANATIGYPELAQAPRANVFLGSHDPLLEWALREAETGIATIFESSLDGLERFSNYEGIASGLHIWNSTDESWNTEHIEKIYAKKDVVLIEWAKRQRGFLIAPERADKIKSIADLKGCTLAPRQKSAGSQILLDVVMTKHGLTGDDFKFISPCKSETDAALAINEGRADAAFGLEAQASHFGLAFLPITEERFDLLIDRRSYFEPPIQALLKFCGAEAFRIKAEAMHGYDISGLGNVRLNG